VDTLLYQRQHLEAYLEADIAEAKAATATTKKALRVTIHCLTSNNIIINNNNN
jgi:hypothetical protein